MHKNAKPREEETGVRIARNSRMIEAIRAVAEGKVWGSRAFPK